MDPITHAVIGAALSKVTGNGIDITQPAAAAIVAGAVFPDIDILLQKWGDYVYLKNHRGFTHSVIGIAVSSLFIAAVIWAVFPLYNPVSLFLWSMAGCFSHTFIDLFNSYGAKLLWPFYDRKLSLSLLVIFDPIFAAGLLGYIFSTGNLQYYSLGMVPVYLVIRGLLRVAINRTLKVKYKGVWHKVSLLPSATGIFRWHFVVETDKSNIVGEKRIFKKGYSIIKELDKIEDEAARKVENSHIGKFFSEFTPLFHVACETIEGITRYVFTDLRYYMRDSFLHHAVLELDSNNAIVKATFNPYSMKRSNDIPSN